MSSQLDYCVRVELYAPSPRWEIVDENRDRRGISDVREKILNGILGVVGPVYGRRQNDSIVTAGSMGILAKLDRLPGRLCPAAHNDGQLGVPGTRHCMSSCPCDSASLLVRKMRVLALRALNDQPCDPGLCHTDSVLCYRLLIQFLGVLVKKRKRRHVDAWLEDATDIFFRRGHVGGRVRFIEMGSGVDIARGQRTAIWGRRRYI